MADDKKMFVREVDKLLNVIGFVEMVGISLRMSC